MSGERTADLHAHTTCSDGALSPEELVSAAQEADLTAFAVTDHDTVDGVEIALRATAGTDIQLVAGIELSSTAGAREIHMLGLFIDPTEPKLGALAQCHRAYRQERADVMIARLQKLGKRIDLEAVVDIAAGAPIGRPHMATALVRAGVVAAPQEAFDRYLGIGRPAFVPKRSSSAVDSIATIHGAGGVAVIAHPGSSRVGPTLLRELAAAGLDGIEVRHPRHSPQRERRLLEICSGLGLLPSGGSDFHGPGCGDARMGQHRIPIEWSERLRDRAEERRAAG